MNFFKSVVDLLVAKSCFCCGRASQAAVCSNCEPLLDYIDKPTCLHCGYPTVREVKKCRQCKGSHFYFQSVMSLLPYEGAARKMLVSLKSTNGYSLIDYFVKEAISRNADFFDAKLVTYIPTTFLKNVERGHNTSELMAKSIAYHLKIKAVKALSVKQGISDQAGLNKEERRENLKNSFKLSAGFSEAKEKILVVDDIFTTGATVNEACRVLNEAGAKTKVFTIARVL